MAKDKTAARVITSLGELEPVRITLEITRADGETVAFSGSPLSVRQWLEVGHAVPPPTPPIMGADSNGKPLYDWNNPDYRRALDEANVRRSYARLIAFLDVEVPGATLDEQIDALEAHLSAGDIQALTAAIGRLYEGEEARIAARGATFHGDGPGAAADDAAARPAVAD